MSLIEIKKLSKAYKSGEEYVMALNNLDLTIEQGEFVSVMGPSGSGKFLSIVRSTDQRK